MVTNEAKLLARAFQQCIRKKEVPYKWQSFKTERDSGVTYWYYVYTRGRPKISVVFCSIAFDYNMADGKEHEGATLRLVFHRGHSDSCD